MTLQFVVHGSPAPQGSKTKWGTEDNPHTRPWRAAVAAEAAAAMNGHKLSQLVAYELPTEPAAAAIDDGTPLFVDAYDFVTMQLDQPEPLWGTANTTILPAGGLALFQEHRPQTGADWVAVAERFIADGGDTTQSSPLFAGLVLAVRQRDSCRKAHW